MSAQADGGTKEYQHDEVLGSYSCYVLPVVTKDAELRCKIVNKRRACSKRILLISIPDNARIET